MMNLMKTLMAVFLLALSMAAQAEVGVARSAFTTAVENREPVDEVGQLGNDTGKIYFFTEIRGMNGHAITHRWEQGGEVRAEVTFNVGGDRWRVWSSKTLDPSWLGEWQVSVVDEGGNVLSQESFAYVPAGESAGAAMESSGEDAGMHEGGDTMSSDKMDDTGDSDTMPSDGMKMMDEDDTMHSDGMGSTDESSPESTQ